MAKSKKERRSSIRHMAADDAFSVLEALEAAEQKAQQAPPDEASSAADTDDDEDTPEAVSRPG